MYELVTSEEAKTYLKLDTVPVDLPPLITNLSARAEAHCRRWFIQRPAVETLDVLPGQRFLYLSHYPVVGTPTVTDLETLTPITGFVVAPDRGMLYLESGWPDGVQRIKVEYTAGLCPDVASVPADVKQACLEWLAARYQRRDPSVKREVLGDYQYSAEETNGLPANVEAALSLYRVPGG
ncbi:MAG: hypothetical protein ACM3ZA_06110, partial [Bacillota bacterium]